MSMFRKPIKRIQRRVFTADDDDEDGEPEPPPPPIISRNENKPAKVKMTSLLSFADEEEEGEVFQVKKSSQSKKLKKKREKEKRRGPDGDSNKYDNNDYEVKPASPEPELPKKKKVTLEGLILSGREAISAEGAGDVSDDDPGSSGSEDSRGFHRYRAESVRAALATAPGHIPDAALIHAARKTRQQARELGDFVPVGNETSKSDGKRSRLVREDGSGDEDEEGRIQVVGLQMPSDKPKRGTCAAASSEDADSDDAAWEAQQLQKAMAAAPDRPGEIEVNPFSLPPPPPPAAAPGAAQLRPLPALPPPATAQQLMQLLTDRLSQLQSDRATSLSQLESLRSRLLVLQRIRERCAASTRQLDAAYRRAQEVRGYLTDLVECLDEKMPLLEGLESRALSLQRRRCELLVERRRQDVRDQAHDVLATGRAGGRQPEDEAKARRVAEREGRRRARRRRREAGGGGGHLDGDSSDDELPPHDLHLWNTEKEEIASSASSLFSDALPAWRSVRGVCHKLAQFRRRQRAGYVDAYIPDSVPRILAPYVRHQLILWNPLADEDNEDWEKMDWYKCLMMYGVRDDKSVESDGSDSDSEEVTDGYPPVTEDSVRDDPDLMLVPTIINKVVLPKITELVEHAWDPVCVRSSVRLRRLLVAATELPGAGAGAGAGARGGVAALAAAVAAKLSNAIANDVFLPTLPPHIAEGSGLAFWRRCAGGGARLLRSALCLAPPPRALAAHTHVLKLLDAICTGAGAAPGPLAAAAAAALAASLPRHPGIRRPALQRLARLATTALTRMEGSVLHLKAIEQARAIIAEAKLAAEKDT